MCCILFCGFRTPFQRIPTIRGKDVDLFLLYSKVTAAGGWEKVSKSLLNLPRLYSLLSITAAGVRCECMRVGGFGAVRTGGLYLGAFGTK